MEPKPAAHTSSGPFVHGKLNLLKWLLAFSMGFSVLSFYLGPGTAPFSDVEELSK